MAGLDWFNGLAAAQAREQLTACCAAGGWAAAVTAGRPYRDVEALLAAARAVLAGLAWPQVAAALAAHPRIGERPAGAGQDAAWSRREQAAVTAAEPAVRAALAEANLEYERRFDRVYLTFASGRTPAQLLAEARERLGHDEETERGVVRAELAKITELRLRRLVGERT
jgi:2-oxo-4-hydroxy-4-carboxy-5-ureidoimidazoline decarboxylase